MKKQVIFMFSGQGSQYYQMGKELYENNAQFKYWMDHCDNIAQPILKTSLIDILYRGKGKGDSFDHILHTNPALLFFEYSMFKVLKEMGIQPDFLLGYSLGEIIASVVSGAISLEDGIHLVINIARLAEEKTAPASMLAIMESTRLFVESPDLFEDCWITGTNFRENFVVGGLPDTIQLLQRDLTKMGITSQVLPVRYGFHTSLIDPMKEDCKQLARAIELGPIKIPIISSLQTESINALTGDHLWEVIRYRVNFDQTVDKLLNKDDYIFVDLGPSGSLATFVRYMLFPNSGSVSLQTLNQFGKDLNSMEKLRSSLETVAC